jgi:hypothetical protein
MKKYDPITPGEILLEEFLRPMGLSQYRLTKEIGVPAQRISEIILVNGELQLIRICNCVDFLACPTVIGCGHRLLMIPRLQNVR